VEPILFNFATKELSQDAFFCWLFSWAEEKYNNTQMYTVAKDLLKDITNENIIINSIEIKQQYKKIDFFLTINQNTVIVFEDKIKTSQHDNQLERYRDIISEEYPEYKLFFVYLKTDILFPHEYSVVEESKYQVYDLFTIFNKLLRKTDNDIYNDYINYLTQKIKSYQDFEKIRYSKWEQNEWIGLCYKLQKELKQSVYYDIWQGRELFWGITESDYLLGKNNVWASLEIKHSLGNNFGRLVIILHIEDDRLNKSTIRDELNLKFEKIFKDENIQINNRTGGIMNFIIFNDFPIVEKSGYINFIKTKEYLKKILKTFEKSVK
jgi:hypothetical protein